MDDNTAAYLLGLKQWGVQPGLERMSCLMQELSHPERATPCVHIAGTNGKGSVAAMVEAILRAAGWRTGLYTSPHLVRLGERIQVDRQPLSEDQIAAWTRELRTVADQLAPAGRRPSYFEFMTAMAFTHFAREKCDIAVIEAGLGGRLDATNVVQPEVSVITSIGLDHREFLGDTLEAIAREKAGIIKPGRPVVIGRLRGEAENVIRRIATERGSPVTSVTERFDHDLDVYPTSSLKGDHQRANAATASLAAGLLPRRFRIDDEAIARGLAAVNWPGRWQRFERSGREIILDAAHNAEGAQALEQALTHDPPSRRHRLVAVMGVLGADRARPLLAALTRHAAEIHFVMPQQSRACRFEELEALLPASYGGIAHRATVAELFPSPSECTAGRAGDTVLVTGSIYLVGEVLARLEPERGPVEQHLQDF